MTKNKILNMKAIVVGTITAIMSIAMPMPTMALEGDVPGIIKFEQKFTSNVLNAEDTFTYELTPVEDDAPLPLGGNEGKLVWSMDGNSTYSVIFGGDSCPDATPNVYHYHVKQTTERKEGYTYDDTEYDIILKVQNDDTFTHKEYLAFVENPNKEKVEPKFENAFYMQPKKEEEKTKGKTSQTGDEFVTVTAITFGMVALAMGAILVITRKKDNIG